MDKYMALESEVDSYTSSEVTGCVILYKHLTALCFNFLIDKMQTLTVSIAQDGLMAEYNDG